MPMLSDTTTHEDINEFVIRTRIDGFSIDSHLKEHLGVKQGIEYEIRGMIRWQVES
jgi:hypothetical protein